MSMKLSFVAEHVIQVELALPHDLASSILAPRHVELELAQIVHLVVGVVRAREDHVHVWLVCLGLDH